MNVKFLDLSIDYLNHQDDIRRALVQTASEFQFIRGRQVSEFEAGFGKKINSRHIIGTGNGTDALFAILKSLAIGPGDEIITPAFSWISSSETISLCGATPVFADVDPEYYCIDPLKVQAKLTSRTKAVIAVHLFGQMADMEALKALCDHHKVYLIEDCAQAHLSSLNNKFAGTFGVAAAFSFYPTKNLGAYGDAGCIATDDDALAVYARRFLNHGALQKDDHEIEGMNSRMDTLQAAVLLSKLPHLEAGNAAREKNASTYNRELSHIRQVITPKIRPGTVHANHIYAIQVEQRNKLKAYLNDEGIQTIVHYPRALPNIPVYRHLKLDFNDFGVSNELQNTMLSLPIYPGLTEQALLYVIEKIKRFYAK